MGDFWKILRILTTNCCNYRCLYCHNEGQEKESEAEMLQLDSFYRIMSAVKGLGFKEIRFSGGEPLINPATIDMIEWLNEKSDYEIGLASNGSMITEMQAERLGRTRTLVTIHFPATDAAEYKRITGREIDSFWKGVSYLENSGVSFSYNHVLYPDTIKNLEDVLDSVIKQGRRVKLLPYIENGFRNLSGEIMSSVSADMDGKAKKKTVLDKEGIIVWEFENGAKVKLLESPCYDHNIGRCREYAELRLLPDLSLQGCIFDRNRYSIKNMESEAIRDKMKEMWNRFERCV